MAKYDSYVNYLIISKGGKAFTCYTHAYTYMLQKYIKNYVGYESAAFKMDEAGWANVGDPDNKVMVNGKEEEYGNYPETNMFNAMCSRPKFKVAKALYNHILAYSSVEALENDIDHATAETYIAAQLETERVTSDENPNPCPAKTYKNCILVNNKGKYFTYTNVTLKAALEKYMTANNLAFEADITTTKDLWDTCNRLKIQNDLNTLVKTFNALCKKSKYRIAVAAMAYDGIVTIT